MNLLQEIAIDCPYCGEPITVLAESLQDEQQYIEDCQVCCRPIVIHLNQTADGECLVEARHEDDA
jgi:hypothetical protein